VRMFCKVLPELRKSVLPLALATVTLVAGTYIAFSAAAAAGTIYRLDGAGFEDALGMAATQSCGLMSAQFESMVKRMQHGFAARNGLTAAAFLAPCVYWKIVVCLVSSVRGAFSVSSLRVAQKGCSGSKAALMPST